MCEEESGFGVRVGEWWKVYAAQQRMKYEYRRRPQFIHLGNAVCSRIFRLLLYKTITALLVLLFDEAGSKMFEWACVMLDSWWLLLDSQNEKSNSDQEKKRRRNRTTKRKHISLVRRCFCSFELVAGVACFLSIWLLFLSFDCSAQRIRRNCTILFVK